MEVCGWINNSITPQPFITDEQIIQARQHTAWAQPFKAKLSQADATANTDVLPVKYTLQTDADAQISKNAKRAQRYTYKHEQTDRQNWCSLLSASH